MDNENKTVPSKKLTKLREEKARNEEKLKKALVDLHAAVESCSSTQCKRIIDGLERIVFAKNQEELINQLKDQVDDYDFGEAEKTIKELEKTL
jgi:hypothetical protein